MIDIIEACLDRILPNVNAMPFTLRYFCKFIYDEAKITFPDYKKEQRYAIVG